MAEDVSDDEGIIPFLFQQAQVDADVTDNVLGFVDTVPLGRFSPGDKFIIGVRGAEVGDVISVPSMPEGIVLTLNADLAQVFDSVHQSVSALFWKLEQSLAMVDKGGGQPVYIDAADVNEILQGFSPLFDVPEIPNVVRIDPAAFFLGPGPEYTSGPKPLRDYLPIWYDDDGSPDTPKEFLVEGESLYYSSAHVAGYDWSHFPDAVQFKGQAVATKIAADGIGPDMGPVFDETIFYIGFQDPTFNGMLFLDLSQLPYLPEADVLGFAPADLYSLNKLLAWLQVGVPGMEIGTE